MSQEEMYNVQQTKGMSAKKYLKEIKKHSQAIDRIKNLYKVNSRKENCKFKRLFL